MSQKALDVRRSVQIVRRHKVLVGIVMVLGAVGGGAYAVLHPPVLTSTALIALQPPTSQNAQNTQQPAAGGIDPFTSTQEVVAASDSVLQAALHDARPAMSLDRLRRNIQVGSPAADIISINAKGKSAADAEATANAVAASYIAYVSSPNSPVGHVSARQLEQAISASAALLPFALIEMISAAGLPT